MGGPGAPGMAAKRFRDRALPGCHVRGEAPDADQFGEAWNVLTGGWLPGSGYQPDDRMCYEVYLNDHERHPERMFIMDICEPVRPL